MLSESLIKTKLKDPLILDLLEIIRGHRSVLQDLQKLEIDSDLSNIISIEKGSELYIENEFHKAKGFRKLHIEVAEFSRNLKILHCVFFPDPKFDIPIFGMDLVKVNDIVSAAIVDLSPVSKDQDTKYRNTISEFDRSCFTSMRDIPSWGKIFSNNVFFAALKNKLEKDTFCTIVNEYLITLIELARNAQPDSNKQIIKERKEYQRNYCIQQMKNDKTSMVLLKYFDEKWVDNYIKNVLFDF